MSNARLHERQPGRKSSWALQAERRSLFSEYTPSIQRMAVGRFLTPTVEMTLEAHIALRDELL